MSILPGAFYNYGKQHAGYGVYLDGLHATTNGEARDYSTGGSASVAAGTVIDAQYGGGSGINAGTTVWTITNAGEVIGRNWGIFLDAGGAISNGGTVIGSSQWGAYLGQGGSIRNLGSSAVIEGGTYGIVTRGGVSTVANGGTITGGSGKGAALNDGGTIVNQGTAAFITGGTAGAYICTVPGKVINSGTILGTGGTGDGVFLMSGGSVSNGTKAARIAGGTYGILIGGDPGSLGNAATVVGGTDGIDIHHGPSTVTNTGAITGTSTTGVLLAAGGIVKNQTAAAAITGGLYGIQILAAAGTIANQGTVTGTGKYGIQLGLGGMVTNLGPAGLVTAGASGILVQGAAGTVNSTGTITGTSTDGVDLDLGGTVANTAKAARITGGQYGVLIAGAEGIVSNTGTITGIAKAGIELAAGGTITNDGLDALISGAGYGILISAATGSVSNEGSISASTGTAIALNAGGMVENEGYIDASAAGGIGILFGGNDDNTVVNGGTISGGHQAIQFGSGDDRLVIESGASFVGNVDGGGGSNTLEFAKTDHDGTFSGLGQPAFTHWDQVLIDPAATWTFTGKNALTDSMTMSIGGRANIAGTMSFADAVNGVGTLSFLTAKVTIDSGADFTMTAWTLEGVAVVTLNEDLTYARAFSAGSKSSLSISAGHVLGFTGTADLAGKVVGPGTLDFAGGADMINLGATLKVATWLVSGTGVVTVADGLTYAGTLSEGTKAAILIDAGDALTLNGKATLAGAVGGGGSLVCGGGQETIGAGAHLTVATWSLAGVASVTFGESLLYTGSLTEGAKASLALGADSLTLSGPALLEGKITGSSTLALGGKTATIAAGAHLSIAHLALSSGVQVAVQGTMTYAGSLMAGAGTALSIAAKQALTLSGGATGDGIIRLGAGAALVSTGSVAKSLGVAFTAATGSLVLTTPKKFAASITGFEAGDHLDLRTTAFAFGSSEKVSFVENAAGTEGVLTVKAGTNSVSVTLFGQYVAAGFHLASDGHGGSQITYTAPASVPLVAAHH